ncbi:MAG: metallophosphoesterase family protein [Desulfohalobiaceae bacterium]
MRLAIISDIHGNLEAFRQVLQDIRELDVQGCYFLGDAISYGPEPERCVRLLQEEQIPCILGNHELALIQTEAKAYFNSSTREHFAQTEALLSERSRAFISTWPKSRQEYGMLLVHGCPPNLVTRYLFELQEPDLLQAMQGMGDNSIAFVGHTHELMLIQCSAHGLLQETISPGTYNLSGTKALINVGSVGQPRDGDNRAKYVIWEPEARQLQIRGVAYDIQKTAQGILDLGFPSFYANRLW